MADSKNSEPKCFEVRFAALDHGERIGRHGRAPRDAGAEARLRGSVRRRQPKLAGKGADFRLGEPGIAEWGDDLELSGGDATGAVDVRKRWGVLFQGGALFSTLTVAENVQVPLREFYPELPLPLLDEIASYKVVMTGLPADAGPKYPAELSGGMKKRAGLARALAMDPELLFLDEPTAGLDPIGAAAFDELTKSLQKTLGLTVFLITHDLDTLYAICDRVAVLADKKVEAVGTIDELLALDHPWIQEYFRGPRGRAAIATQEAHSAEAEAARHPTEVKANATGQPSQGDLADNTARKAGQDAQAASRAG